MPAKARHEKAPDANPPEGRVDNNERVRSLLMVCVHMLGQGGEQGAPKAQADPTPDLKEFTERELEFLRLVQHPDCWPYEYIAARMGLKLPTFHYLRRKLFKKLKVKSRTALALKVRDWDLG